MRSCCITGCKTGGRMLTHGIPKNRKRRKEWLEILKINETEENKIDKLRICYKHFKVSDYSCTVRKRRLVDRAVPSIDTTHNFEDKTDHTYAKILAHEQKMKIYDQSIQAHEQKMQTYDQSIQAHEPSIQAHEQKMKIYDQSIQAHEQKMQAYDQRIFQLKEYTISMKKQKHVTHHQESTRKIKATKQPYLVVRNTTTTTIRQLCNINRRICDDNTKLRQETKRLKQRIADLEEKLKTRTLNTKDSNGRRNENAVMCQRIVNMIVRNHNVAPKIY